MASAMALICDFKTMLINVPQRTINDFIMFSVQQ